LISFYLINNLQAQLL